MNKAEIIKELEKIRATLTNSVGAVFDRLIQAYESGEVTTDIPAEYVYPFTADTNIFIGKKPAAVLFGEERVEADNWRKVYAAIIGRCNADPECHEKLMYLRNKVAGRDRVLLSRSSDGMRRPYKIDEDMYGEVQYGTATLLYILRDRILAYTSFDYSDIRIVLKRQSRTAT